ncbi:RDD family protein [Salipaludibacillus sp. CF4.18]|uniref:RDD family protein n=1 Tax=Salipaludibacillus sp. CF4.18 TaxID=3373081 RepID=UPI003EE54D1C
MEVKDPAGFWVRFAAGFLDGLVVMFVTALLSTIIYRDVFIERFTIVDTLSPLYYLILPVIWYGYTVGKRALGIRIARIDGAKVGITTLFLRHLLAGIVYAVTLGIGVIVSAFMVGMRKDSRAIHDFIAGTYVTSSPPK